MIRGNWDVLFALGGIESDVYGPGGSWCHQLRIYQFSSIRG